MTNTPTAMARLLAEASTLAGGEHPCTVLGHRWYPSVAVAVHSTKRVAVIRKPFTSANRAATPTTESALANPAMTGALTKISIVEAVPMTNTNSAKCMCDNGTCPACSSPIAPKCEAPFQARVHPWMLACFGAEIAADKQERSHRFLEESLELVQAAGCTKAEALQLVDYVYGRPAGYLPQEVGGVMVTLAALCLAQAIDMHEEGETELARIWTKIDVIRAKQAAKPKHSPLPSPIAGAEVRPESVNELRTIEAFLDGNGLLESSYFGEMHAFGTMGRYWWRKPMHAAINRVLSDYDLAVGRQNYYRGEFHRIAEQLDSTRALLCEARREVGRLTRELAALQERYDGWQTIAGARHDANIKLTQRAELAEADNVADHHRRIDTILSLTQRAEAAEKELAELKDEYDSSVNAGKLQWQRAEAAESRLTTATELLWEAVEFGTIWRGDRIYEFIAKPDSAIAAGENGK